MESKKHENSSTQEELVTSKLFPHSILLKKEYPKVNSTPKIILKVKDLKNKKRVNFPDEFKRPLHVIYEVEPIFYESFENNIKKKSKAKGCSCVIY